MSEIKGWWSRAKLRRLREAEGKAAKAAGTTAKVIYVDSPALGLRAFLGQRSVCVVDSSGNLLFRQQQDKSHYCSFDEKSPDRGVTTDSVDDWRALRWAQGLATDTERLEILRPDGRVRPVVFHRDEHNRLKVFVYQPMEESGITLKPRSGKRAKKPAAVKEPAA